MRVLILVSLLSLVGCSTENHPLFPQKAPRTAPSPTKPELPPTTTTPEPAPEPAKWVPHDFDIVGRWKKPCALVPSLPGKSLEDEIAFVGDRVQLTTYTYSDVACAKSLLLASEKSELIFEEGWEDSAPRLGGKIVQGWRGLFIKEENGMQSEMYEVSTHLAYEFGSRVLYIKWAVPKPVPLDPVQDRYVFVGLN